MGTEVSEDDVLNILNLCDQVIALAEYRAQVGHLSATSPPLCLPCPGKVPRAGLGAPCCSPCCWLSTCTPVGIRRRQRSRRGHAGPAELNSHVPCCDLLPPPPPHHHPHPRSCTTT